MLVECQHIWEHGGMGLRVGQVEGATEYVTNFVMQAGPSRGEGYGGQVGAIECVLAASKVLWIGNNLWQSAMQRTDPLARQRSIDGIGFRRPQGISTVCQAVESGGHRELNRHGQRAGGVVDDGVGR